MIVLMNALQQAISQTGGQSKLAKAIGVAPQVVNNWLARKNVPADHCPAIEKATGGAIRCEDLRPDVEWSVVRGTCLVAESSGYVQHVECCSGDPRHGDRRRPEMRDQIERRKDEVS